MEAFKNFCRKNKIQLIFAGAGVVIIAAIIIALVAINGKEKINDEAETTTVPEATTVADMETETEDPNAGKVRSLLTGEYVSKTVAARRPVAVMINNISDAWPQSGIGDAGVIYEAPVEGGITRLMALFENYKGIEKIGSIRSCRIYYCYFALEWDAIYCHYGQSQYALDFLNSDNIDNVSSYNSGGYFYQTSDRVAPHNTFIDDSGIDSAIKTLDYRRKYEDDYSGRFTFAGEESPVELTDGMAAKTVEISYPHNYPYFQYDQESKTYLRYQGGQKHIDDQKKKDQQLSCKNIIVQFVDYSMFPDGKSLNLTLTGSGKGYYITNGKSIEVNWSKDELLGVTKYTNAATGEEISLNAGKTWICIVQNGMNVTISE